MNTATRYKYGSTESIFLKMTPEEPTPKTSAAARQILLELKRTSSASPSQMTALMVDRTIETRRHISHKLASLWGTLRWNTFSIRRALRELKGLGLIAEAKVQGVPHYYLTNAGARAAR